MEMKVQQIWHVLSGYEESSAALIGDMLRAVNGRQLLEIIFLAERFILHVETLFAVIDDIEAQFALAAAKGKSLMSRLPITNLCRYVTCSGGQAVVPQTCQPVLDHIADISPTNRSAEFPRHVHPHHSAGTLLEDPDSHRLDGVDQA